MLSAFWMPHDLSAPPALPQRRGLESAPQSLTDTSSILTPAASASQLEDGGHELQSCTPQQEHLSVSELRLRNAWET
jgi:hypothetical protein